MASRWEKLRADFPLTKKRIYLDHAACGPVPEPVAACVRAYYESNAREGDAAWPRWLEEREAVRRRVARFIHAEPEEITFTQSTSHGMNLIAELLASQGAVAASEAEFPSSTLPWLWRKVPVHFYPDKQGIQDPETFVRQSRAKTLVASFVQYASGYRQNLEAMGKHKEKRFLVVNATQGFGALEVDVKKWNADFLCTNSYKWLLAGYGGGVLFIRKRWLSRFQPESAGWRSMRFPDQLDNRKLDLSPHASRYELGCPSFPTIFAVGAAVEYLSSIGIEKIEKRILSLSRFAVEELTRHGFEVTGPDWQNACRSGIVVFNVPQAVSVWKRLLEQRIHVSPRGNGIRFSPHFYNTFEEIETAVRKIRKMV